MSSSNFICIIDLLLPVDIANIKVGRPLKSLLTGFDWVVLFLSEPAFYNIHVLRWRSQSSTLLQILPGSVMCSSRRIFGNDDCNILTNKLASSSICTWILDNFTESIEDTTDTQKPVASHGTVINGHRSKFETCTSNAVPLNINSKLKHTAFIKYILSHLLLRHGFWHKVAELGCLCSTLDK